MVYYKWIITCFCIFFVLFSCTSFAATPVKSIVFFGDSVSDVGNTTHLLKSLRQDEDPSYIVAPFRIYFVNKMNELADIFHVPQSVLESSVAIVDHIFDYQIAFPITFMISQLKLVPIFPGEPYWNYRFSNGPVWSEYLVPMIVTDSSQRPSVVNLAFSGSWAATFNYQVTIWKLLRHPIQVIKRLIVGKLIPPSLGITVQAYLLENTHLNPDTLYFIFSGNNDYVNGSFSLTNYLNSKYVENVVGSIEHSVSKLAKAGARHFIIMGVPHLGDTPRMINTNERNVVNTLIDGHNRLLQYRIKELEYHYPDVDFMYVNMQDYFDRVIQHAGFHGFTNVTDACIDIKLPRYDDSVKGIFANNYVLAYAHRLNQQLHHMSITARQSHLCATPDTYLFWDEIHPSTKAHSLLANEVCKDMASHGYAVSCA